MYEGISLGIGWKDFFGFGFGLVVAGNVREGNSESFQEDDSWTIIPFVQCMVVPFKLSGFMSLLSQIMVV